MTRRAYRGILSLAEKSSPFRTTITSKERARRKLATLQFAPLGSFPWKEAWSEFKHLSKSRPDLHGRRLRDEKAIAKAQYLARVAYRAWKGRALPQGRGWGHMRSALFVVYRELA
jgi:hypothetical protein